jgi:hypothetical protein
MAVSSNRTPLVWFKEYDAIKTTTRTKTDSPVKTNGVLFDMDDPSCNHT